MLAWCDLAERLVPGDPLEPPFALRADAPERVEQPVGRARVVEVAGDLGAQGAAGERVLGVAAEVDGLAVAHRHDPGAAVRAVERAGAGHVAFHAP
jgi:hypothetical protein